MLQIVASLTDDTRSVNYDRNTFIIQATERFAREIQFHLLGATFGNEENEVM